MGVDGQAIVDRADSSTARLAPRPLTDRGIPPLNAGDHLSRAEFERRYSAMPNVKKAELVEGIVFMPSPASVQHGEPHAFIIGWLLTYAATTPTIRLLDNTSLRLDTRNEVQPDAMLLVDEAHGGRCRVAEDGLVQGSPEFVAEVATSSVSYDLHSKLRAYQRNGVQEYLVLLTYEQRIIWHVLDAGKYVPMQPDENGVLRSRAFPGLWLDPTRFWNGDIKGLLTVLGQGLASADHAEFAALLQAS